MRRVRSSVLSIAILAAGVLAIPAAAVEATNVIPTNGMVITSDTTLAPGVYNLPDGISIAASDITLDGNGATIVGGTTGYGLSSTGSDHVVVRNLNISGFFHGMHFSNCADLTIEDCTVHDTPELPEGGIFLNIFDGPTGVYAHAIWLRYCDNAVVQRCNVADQQNGISLFNCSAALVADNEASFNTGWGIYFYDTDYSTVRNNIADYCTRDFGGWSGADAASFMIVYNSDHNEVYDNSFVGGGDGVFLAGATHSLQSRPCNFNYFARNDCSDSPNNGFEATFSEGNIFEDNISDGCNYGYWLGYSHSTTVRNNRANGCATAGVAIEHGRNNTITGNTFSGNGRGIYLWTDGDAGLVSAFPDARDSYNYDVSGNTLTNNTYGLLCEAHDANRLSYDYRVTGNSFGGNVYGVRFLRTTASTLRDNVILDSVSHGMYFDQSSANTIFNNRLVNLSNAWDNGINSWSTTKTAEVNIIGGPFLGGNYWSDYTGEDNTGDGLGDTQLPHTSGNGIAAGGDNLPLTVFVDDDHDGLDDDWELLYFENLDQGPEDNPDHDGLTNFEELIHRTDPTKPDTDGDTLIDGDEVHIYNTDPTLDDTDDDGLDDADEINRGTNPRLADTDQDLMPDGWEVAHNLNPLVNDANLDPDNDGYSSFLEFEADADPMAPWSIPSRQYGAALRFDGADDFLTLGDVAVPGAQLTLEVWVNPQMTGSARLIDKQPDYSVQLAGSNVVRFVTFEDFIWDVLDGETTVPIDAWTHIACVLTGSKKQIYVNGQLDAEKDYTHVVSVSDNALIVAADSPAATQGFFHGDLDDVRVWQTGRTAADIQAWMNKRLGGNPADLVGYWDLDDAAGQTATDRAGDHDGTLGASPAPDTRDPLWTPSPVTPGDAAENGPAFSALNAPVFAAPDEPILITVAISDANDGDDGVASAVLYYDYAFPFNGQNATGVSPGGNGDGVWTFTLPAPGADHLGETLAFFLRADDAAGNFTFASNSAALYPVTLGVAGDADHDGDVDLADYASLQTCFGGSADSGCAAVDFDASRTVDLADVASFLAALTGPIAD